jgi:hypothetical protein
VATAIGEMIFLAGAVHYHVLQEDRGAKFLAKCAFFMRLMREARKLKTRWRRELKNCRATSSTVTQSVTKF